MDESYRPILKTFEKMSGHYGNAWGMEEANRHVLSPFITSSNGLILDIGCGTGTMIEKYIRSVSHEIVTIDFSHNMLFAASKRLKKNVGTVKFVQGFALSLPFQNESFDTVVSVNTLHNLPSKEDVKASLAEISRVLRLGGKAIVEFRNKLNLRRRQVASLFDMPSLPQRAFTLIEMRKMLQSTGLSIERVVPIFSASVMGGRMNPVIEATFKLFLPWYAPCYGLIAAKKTVASNR